MRETHDTRQGVGVALLRSTIVCLTDGASQPLQPINHCMFLMLTLCGTYVGHWIIHRSCLSRFLSKCVIPVCQHRSVLCPLGIPSYAINRTVPRLLLIKVNFSAKQCEPKRLVLFETNIGLLSKRFPISKNLLLFGWGRGLVKGGASESLGEPKRLILSAINI